MKHVAFNVLLKLLLSFVFISSYVVAKEKQDAKQEKTSKKKGKEEPGFDCKKAKKATMNYAESINNFYHDTKGADVILGFCFVNRYEFIIKIKMKDGKIYQTYGVASIDDDGVVDIKASDTRRMK